MSRPAFAGLIAPDALAARLGDENLVVIDIRTAADGGREAFEAGHIPGAVNLPTTTCIRDGGALHDAAEVRSILWAHGIDPDGEVVLYCGTGVASAHSALALATAGIDAAVYAGSWSQWARDRRRPVAVGPTPGDAFRGW